jgi:hypothetical protein
MSRTIIVGKDVNTVRRILFVLSYFIRCNEVYERMEHMIPIESQFEERKKAWMKCENNLQDDISSNISSLEDTTQKLSSSSSEKVKIIDNLSKNAEDSYKTKMSNSQQVVDSRDFTENLLEVPMPR